MQQKDDMVKSIILNFSHRSELKRIFGSVCYTRESCGMEYVDNQLTLDHVIPRAFGGTQDITNKQLLCRKCHARKNTWYNIDMGANKL